MALWSTDDDALGKPKFLNDADKAITVAVDPQEAAANKLTAGWVQILKYTDAQGKQRRKTVPLIACGTISFDGDSTSIDDDLSSNSGFNTSYPIPGSGEWLTAEYVLDPIVYNQFDSNVNETYYFQSTPPSEIPGRTVGLLRSKYDGNFCENAMDTVSSYDLSFFNTRQGQALATIQDTSGGWGQQMDGDVLGESQFSVEWKGYIRLNNDQVINDPSSQMNGYGGDDWQFFVESDDTCAVWIGSDATTQTLSAETAIVSGSNSLERSQPIRLDSGWYPIRIWFSEFSGGCKFQLYALSSHGDKWQLGDNNIDLAYSAPRNGY